MKVVERVGSHDAHDERADDRPERPESHGRRPADLRAEVADEGWGGHEDGAFDQTEQADHRGERPLGVRGRDAEGDEDAHDEQPVDHDVGASEPVGPAGWERSEGADGIGDDDDPDVEGERHVVRRQDVRGDAGLRVVRVVQDDRGDDCQTQEPDPSTGVRVFVDLVDEEEAEYGAAPFAGYRRRRIRGHRDPPSATEADPLGRNR